MLPTLSQYVNVHAHRDSMDEREWVIRSMMLHQYQAGEKHGSALSLGIHPWELSMHNPALAIEAFKRFLEDPSVLAIGECGLDKAIDTSLESQMLIFEKQVFLAEEKSMPLIIHAVRAMAELLDFMKVHKPVVPMIIHGFRGSVQMGIELLNAGYYLSVGSYIKHSIKVQSLLREMPLERLFLETDESQASVIPVYEELAAIRSCSSETIREMMHRNIHSLFKTQSGI